MSTQIDTDALPFDERRLVISDSQRSASFSGADFTVFGFKPAANGNQAYFEEFAYLQTLSISTVRDAFAKRVLGSSWVEEFSMGARSVAGTLAFVLVDGDSLRHFRDVWKQNSKEEAANPFNDAIPPFNIVVSATNEMGVSVSGVLIGVQLVNTGMTVGIQDTYTEQTFSYVARRFIPVRGSVAFKENLQDFIQSDPDLSGILKDTYGSLDQFWQVTSLKSLDKLSVALRSRDSAPFDSEQPADIIKRLINKNAGR